MISGLFLFCAFFQINNNDDHTFHNIQRHKTAAQKIGPDLGRSIVLPGYGCHRKSVCRV